jgi:hypothetical protein
LCRVLLPSCQHPDIMFIHLNMLSEFGHAVARCNMVTSQTAHAVPISLWCHDVEQFRQHNIISPSIGQHAVAACCSILKHYVIYLASMISMLYSCDSMNSRVVRWYQCSSMAAVIAHDQAAVIHGQQHGQMTNSILLSNQNDEKIRQNNIISRTSGQHVAKLEHAVAIRHSMSQKLPA